MRVEGSPRSSAICTPASTFGCVKQPRKPLILPTAGATTAAATAAVTATAKATAAATAATATATATAIAAAAATTSREAFSSGGANYRCQARNVRPTSIVASEGNLETGAIDRFNDIYCSSFEEERREEGTRNDDGGDDDDDDDDDDDGGE
uniref:Uncharacterized protein n=1 Tax=Vespula pensylvanica TaxID=30213 RepID=A0A834NX42_VESPE|nr:hypothetical protein H0235_010131 [Vespula pensylvanica]